MMSKKRKPVLVKARTSVMNPFFHLNVKKTPREQMENDACESLFSAFCSLQRMPLTFSHGHPLFIYRETDCFVYKEQNACDLVHYHPSIPIKIVYLRL